MWLLLLTILIHLQTATSTLGDSNDMLAALKAKMEKERKIILNLSYNSKAP
jgi:hypothetical protein